MKKRKYIYENKSEIFLLYCFCEQKKEQNAQHFQEMYTWGFFAPEMQFQNERNQKLQLHSLRSMIAPMLEV